MRQAIAIGTGLNCKTRPVIRYRTTYTRASHSRRFPRHRGPTTPHIPAIRLSGRGRRHSGQIGGSTRTYARRRQTYDRCRSGSTRLIYALIIAAARRPSRQRRRARRIRACVTQFYRRGLQTTAAPVQDTTSMLTTRRVGRRILCKDPVGRS